jgi:hypothetical protein
VSLTVVDTNSCNSLSSFYLSTSTKPYQNYYYNKYHEGILEIAKGFLKILLNQLVDKTMVAAVKEKEKENKGEGGAIVNSYHISTDTRST